MYQIILENRVQRDLRQFRSEVLERLIKGFRMLAENPRPRGAKKLAGTDGWRVRIGKYRILYSVHDERRLVIVYHVGHRKDVYR
jgi:mRNA interferase RelE/StbE